MKKIIQTGLSALLFSVPFLANAEGLDACGEERHQN